MDSNGKNMAGASLDRPIKKPTQEAPKEQGQGGSPEAGASAPGQMPVDPSQAEGAQQSLNQPKPEVPDFSYMDSFAEAFRQAKGSGAPVFRWKPDRFGNDTYSTGIQDVAGSNPATPAPGPETMKQGQTPQGNNPNNVDTPTGEENRATKKPGIMSRMANKIMGK